MRPLTNTYKKSGYVYTLVTRQGNVAAYEQRDDETGQVYGYEVFIVQFNEARDIFGKHFEANESVPNSEKWGTEAYTCRHKEDIAQFLTILQARIDQRIQNAFKRSTYSQNLADRGEGGAIISPKNKTA